MAPWLTADSSLYSVLSFNLSSPITLSRSLTLCLCLCLCLSLSLSHFFFFLILSESVSRVKSVNGFLKKKFGLGLEGSVRVGLDGPGKGWLGLKYYI